MTIDEVMNKAMLLRSATDELVVIDQLYEAIAAYGAAERERCAVVCEREASLFPEYSARDFRVCAAAIRKLD